LLSVELVLKTPIIS